MFGIRIPALILAAALALSSGANTVVTEWYPSHPVFQRAASIHPLTDDNIDKTDEGYILTDWETGDRYLFDEDTVLDPESEWDIPGYDGATPALEWFEAYLSAPIDPGLGFGMGDIFDVLVTDEHIDVVRGVYWWD